jgi:3'(2'), 5'-bisphosphate nucleotidase
VRQASRLARQIQGELVTPALQKSDKSPVTVADFAVQAVVARRLRESFPADPLVGEEDAGELREEAAADTRTQVARFVGRIFPEATPELVCDWIDQGGAEPAARFWTLDPIDGTKGFLRGDQYAVALALIENGRVVLGVLGCPNLVDGGKPDHSGPGSVVVALAGQGTWVAPIEGPGNFARLKVSEIADPSSARMLRSYEASHTNVDQMGDVASAFGAKADPVLMDSQAKYAVLAAGRGDALFRLLSPKQPDYREKIWDQAAGSLVVEEAGGRVTDLSGRPLDFTQGRTLANNQGVLATNSRLHAAALAAVGTGRA